MNIAVVDDVFDDGERIRNFLCRYAAESGEDINVSVYSSAEEFAQNMGFEYSAVFTDILMPEITGMDMAREIRSADNDIPIIFVSADREFALEGYDVQAFDYLVKPVEYERVKRVINRLLKVRSSKVITVKQNRYDVNIPVNTIMYAEAGNHKTEIFTTRGSFSVYTSFRDLCRMLSEYENFAECRRGIVANFDMVRKLGDDFLIMRDNAKLYMSRNKNTEIKRQYAEYIFSKTRGDAGV